MAVSPCGLTTTEYAGPQTLRAYVGADVARQLDDVVHGLQVNHEDQAKHSFMTELKENGLCRRVGQDGDRLMLALVRHCGLHIGPQPR